MEYVRVLVLCCPIFFLSFVVFAVWVGLLVEWDYFGVFPEDFWCVACGVRWEPYVVFYGVYGGS